MTNPQCQDLCHGRIQRRLMAWGLSLLSLALLINTFAGSLYTRHAMRESTARRQAEVALFTARHIQGYLGKEIKRLEDAGAAMMMFPFGGEQQRLLVGLLLDKDDSMDEVTLLDAGGRVVLRRLAGEAKPAAATGEYKDATEFRMAIAGNAYVNATPGAGPSEPFRVTMALPLKDAHGSPVGVLAARARLDFLRRALSEVEFSHHGNAYVIDDSGLLIIHSDPSFAPTKRDISALPKARQFFASQSADVSPAAEVKGIKGQTVLGTYARIPDLGWGVIIEEPLDALLAESQDLYVYALVLLALGLLLGAAIIVWLSRRITRPIENLRSSVEIIRRGDLRHRADLKTGDEIEELAREFNHMAAALEQSRITLEQRVAQRTEEISTLYEVTAMVSQSLDVEAVLDAVIKKITALFGFDTTRVYLHDSESDLFSLRACFEVNPEPWVNIASFKCGQSIVGKVVESGRPKIFADVAHNPAYYEMSESRTSAVAGMDFLAAFPVKTKHSCYGALVFSAKVSRSLTEEEIRLLGSMAEQIGVAVENSLLYQQARSKTAHLMVLNEVTAAVSRSLDLETVLREALDKVVGILKFDAAWAYMMDAKAQQLRLEAHKGLSSKTAEMLASQSARSGIGKAVVSSGHRPALETDPERERCRAVFSSNRIQPAGYRGSIAVPIKTRDTVIGVLYAVNWQSRRYTADDLGLIESVAQEIGVAVENAKLFAEIKKQSTELEKINHELRTATQAKSEFIAAMSHELRTPLNIMIGNADITHDGIFGEINDEQKIAMRKITRNGHVLLKMINDLLKLSRLEARHTALEPAQADIAEVLQHARDQVMQLNRDDHLEIGWHVDEGLPSIFTDPVKFEEILHNLIDNAFKFTPAGRIDISARNAPERERVEFSVSDTGIGIDPDNLERVFEKFEQVKSPGKVKNDGVGLGLSIVKKYLDLMQGGIRVESAQGKGARFIFWLPYTLSLPDADAPPEPKALTYQARNS